MLNMLIHYKRIFFIIAKLDSFCFVRRLLRLNHLKMKNLNVELRQYNLLTKIQTSCTTF